MACALTLPRIPIPITPCRAYLQPPKINHNCKREAKAISTRKGYWSSEEMNWHLGEKTDHIKLGDKDASEQGAKLVLRTKRRLVRCSPAQVTEISAEEGGGLIIRNAFLGGGWKTINFSCNNSILGQSSSQILRGVEHPVMIKEVLEAKSSDLMRSSIPFSISPALQESTSPRLSDSITTLWHTTEQIKSAKDKEISAGHEKRVRGTSWCPPAKDVLKVNVDAAWTQGMQFSSIGIIIRDCHASLLAGDHKRIRSPSPLIAEALAVREGFLLAFNLGCQRVVIESDNLELVDSCSAGIMQGEISIILCDIFQLQKHFQLCNFTWTNRERNGVAHEIARLCFQNLLNHDWMFNPPQDLRRALTKDAMVAAEINGFPTSS